MSFSPTPGVGRSAAKLKQLSQSIEVARAARGWENCRISNRFFLFLVDTPFNEVCAVWEFYRYPIRFDLFDCYFRNLKKKKCNGRKATWTCTVIGLVRCLWRCVIEVWILWTFSAGNSDFSSKLCWNLNSFRSLHFIQFFVQKTTHPKYNHRRWNKPALWRYWKKTKPLYAYLLKTHDLHDVKHKIFNQKHERNSNHISEWCWLNSAPKIRVKNIRKNVVQKYPS